MPLLVEFFLIHFSSRCAPLIAQYRVSLKALCKTFPAGSKSLSANPLEYIFGEGGCE